MLKTRWTRWFSELGIDDVPLVGGKNASLGEMVRELSPLGVSVPAGYAVTADAYRYFLESHQLEVPVREAMAGLRRGDVEDLTRRSRLIQNLIMGGDLPEDLEMEILRGYRKLSEAHGEEHADVEVRSSATAEDLPTASFAGQQESFLNVRGEAQLLEAVKKCFASLFTPRAINYREDMGFDHFQVALSVGVQKMVRSDLASSGVIFTLDTESGFPDVVFVTSTWGLGENIVQGRVVPDSFYVQKPTLKEGYRPLIQRQRGSKEFKLIYDASGHRLVVNVPTSPEERASFSVSDEDFLRLARWAVDIESHYSEKRGTMTFMDIEWAKDGATGELFILQARPETVHGQRLSGRAPKMHLYRLRERGEVLVEGLAVGSAVASGPARVLKDPSEIQTFRPGEVLVTEITDPDWEPIMEAASAIVTERGGRTSRAAIVARELGIPAILGTGDATRVIETGRRVTVSCAEGEVGRVYDGTPDYEVKEIDAASLGHPRTQIMMNVANPEQVFELAQMPSDGVGLARMEFIFAGWVGVHPLSLTRYESLSPRLKLEVGRLTRGYEDKTEFFVDKLAQGIGTLAAAFWPRDVILLELRAVKRVREDFGLKNLKVMVPFCRTPEEGREVLEVMREGGLVRGEDGLEVYVMAEIPSNVILAREFDAAHKAGRKVGICGQAPSDYPDFAAFLVEKGIDSVSLSLDAVVPTTLRILEVE